MHDSAESKKAVKRDAAPAAASNNSNGSSGVLLGSSSKRGALLQCGASTTDVFAQLDSRAAAAGAHRSWNDVSFLCNVLLLIPCCSMRMHCLLHECCEVALYVQLLHA
jgi:hypothetical protein